MSARRLALSLPLDIPMADHVAVAREMEALGYTDAWSFEADGADVFTPAAIVAAGTTLRVGTAIANVFTRGPATLAMTAATIAELAPGRFVLGIGAGSAPIVESWNGMTFEKPLTRVKEMVAFLRRALAGERVVFEGETLRVDGFRLSRPPAVPPPLHVAALREGMLRVAGQVADGVCLNWLSADDVKKAVAIVRAAAAEAGRDPASIEVTARIMVNIDAPSADQDTAMRRHICAYLNVPTYRAFHRWLGRGPALDGMWTAWDAGDRKSATAALTTGTIDELIVNGDPAARRAHVDRYFEAGVDTAFLSLATSEREPARRAELEVQALRDHAPR
ncbi:MAG: LLM class F420-dependent oxidoreductase [Dehalococcoidia bacterium]